MTEHERHFRAEELEADGSLSPVELAFSGDPESGWSIRRNGAPHLRLGPGYALLRTERCGVCSTDLDRPFLPFPLPQVVGHELVARDARGRRVVVEINASHDARRDATPCPFCRDGLATHCPERLVLGIHDLPGGFGPHVLAPVGAVLPVPDAVPDEAAVLVEPFAAALHAVDRIDPRPGERVAVLGTRRLGLLGIAALAARRRERGTAFTIVGWSRHAALRERARALGADEVGEPPPAEGGPAADVVLDTTGSPDGFARALALARREVHLKSTHGQPSGGLTQATALVVDELTVAPLPARPAEAVAAIRAFAMPSRPRPVVGWLAAAPPPDALAAATETTPARDAAALLERVSRRPDDLPRADVVVVDRLDAIDAAIRPSADAEIGPVRPRGAILLHDALRTAAPTAPLVEAVAGRSVRVGSSRCGRFADALGLLEHDPELRRGLAALITHRLAADRLGEALALARGPDAVKVVVEHRLSEPESESESESARGPARDAARTAGS